MPGPQEFALILTEADLNDITVWAEGWQGFAEESGRAEAVELVGNVGRLLAHIATISAMVDELCTEGDHALKGSSCRCGENYL